MFKEIIILAKSYKKNNYCIAGIELETGKWIRPISNDYSIEYAVSPDKLKYSDNEELNVLDIVNIKFAGYANNTKQPENWFYEEDFIWEKIGKSSVKDVLLIHTLEYDQYVFSNADNYLHEDNINLNNKSLMLINTETPTINVQQHRMYPNSLKCKLSFIYNNVQYYDVPVTDILIIEKYKRFGKGEYVLADNLPIVFSLTDVFKGSYYKLAVQFITPDML